MRSPMRSPRVSSRLLRRRARIPPAKGAGVGVVGGDDGGAAIVVAGVEDVGDGVPDPVGGLGGAELVEDEDFGVEDGREDLEFGGLDLSVVGVLDLLEEFAVVDEEAGGAAFGDEGLQDADGEVSFADADGAGEQEAGAAGFERVGLDEFAGGEVGLFE